MFIRVRQEGVKYIFTVVDALTDDGPAEVETILHLGIVEERHLQSEQAWYGIAERLVASALQEHEKRSIAHDLACWLPALSLERLHLNRQHDLDSLNELGAALAPDVFLELDAGDPLQIVAGWLETD